MSNDRTILTELIEHRYESRRVLLLVPYQLSFDAFPVQITVDVELRYRLERHPRLHLELVIGAMLRMHIDRHVFTQCRRGLIERPIEICW